MIRGNAVERRPRLVAACFFPAFTPPSSGGEQRVVHLYGALSKFFDVHLITATAQHDPEQTIRHLEGFNETRVPRHPENDALIWKLMQEGIGDECSAYAVGKLASPQSRFAEVLRRQSIGADLIVHECPFTYPFDSPGADRIPRVYFSQNNESRLARQMLKGIAGASAAEEIERWERALVSASKLVFACSDEEAKSFVDDYGVDPEKLALAPNGFVPSKAMESVRGGNALFMGSRHPPNVEALREIVEKIAPQLPQVEFTILGSVCGSIPGKVPPNVRLLGMVPEEEKATLLATCAVAINPLRSGAGTNLKMLDYLGAGAPVLTTPMGARGLDLVDGLHARIVDIEGFACALDEMLGDEAVRSRLSNEGRLHAESRYTWEAIASSVAHVLQRLVGERRHKILALCDYGIAKPNGGGQVRMRALFQELATDWEVDLLCLHDGQSLEIEDLSPGLTEIRVPKTEAHRALELASMVGERISIGDVLAGRECSRNPDFVRAFLDRLASADIVWFEQPYLSDMLDHLGPGHRVVYASQNVEEELKRKVLAPRRDAGLVVEEVAAREARLLHRADLIFCVSKEDRTCFRRLRPNGRYRVIENGTRLPSLLPRVQRSEFGMPMAVFVGSAHPPNVDAARFIIESIAPASISYCFAIVGQVCDAVAHLDRTSNVLLLGRLDDEEKTALFQLSDVAINPMYSGGGSSLKVPDFWAHGLPLLSTSIGVRGFPCTPGKEVVICESASEFIAALEAFRADLPGLRRMGLASRQSAEALDWRSLGQRLGASLGRLVRRAGGKRSVLVVTYRFGHPLRGGAEVYLDSVARVLASKVEWNLTIAATSCSTIENAYSFSAHYAPSEAGDRLPDWARTCRVELFPVDPPPKDLIDRCAALAQAWMRRSRRLGERMLPRLRPFELAGGWNYPEETERGKARWMSRAAQVLLPESGMLEVVPGGSDLSGLELRSPSGLILARCELPNGGVSFRIGADDTGLCTLTHEPLPRAPGDPRELACWIAGLEFVDFGGAKRRLDLGSDALARLAASGDTEWVRLLIEETRNDNSLHGFADVRGPRSLRMLEWVRENAGAHDVVLVQGVPFATSIDVTAACKQIGVPVVVLPHLHIEDAFYHWPEIYRCLGDADAVIAFPAEAAGHYLSPLGAAAVEFPGGGVDPHEFDTSSVSAAVDAFRSVHAGRRPFLLVLGRKAGAKRYDRVIDAHQRLVDAGMEVDLVLIGPDEDHAPVRGHGVHYLGAQPRKVILGALHEAICLVSMSESESFGIVILEAWMAGIPVIANGGCMAFRQLVAHGENGQLVASDDELDAAIRLYLESPRQRVAHAANGKRRAAAYQWPDVANRVADLLESISQ